MKSFLIALAIVSTTSVASASYILTRSVRGCSFWSYSSVANGYICSSPDPQIQVPDAYSLQNELTSLEMKNQELEARIKALEAK